MVAAPRPARPTTKVEPIKVELTASEMLRAGFIGLTRNIRETKNPHSTPKYGQQGVLWNNDIEGALAEMAVAKALNVYWDPTTKSGAGDVGLLEIRTTTHTSGRLIVHPSDPDNAPFVSVVGMHGTYEIVGWIMGCDAKKTEYWQDPSRQNRPAYFVPRVHLNPLVTLEHAKYARNDRSC